MSEPITGRVQSCPACNGWSLRVSDVDPDATLGDLYEHLRRHHKMDTPQAQEALGKAEVTHV